MIKAVAIPIALLVLCPCPVHSQGASNVAGVYEFVSETRTVDGKTT